MHVSVVTSHAARATHRQRAYVANIVCSSFVYRQFKCFVSLRDIVNQITIKLAHQNIVLCTIYS